MAKQQEDKTLTLNFEEAGIENKKSIRLFRDYEERRFLIGYVPEKTKDWIHESKYRLAWEELNGESERVRELES